jgi:cardiolipin synthase
LATKTQLSKRLPARRKRAGHSGELFAEEFRESKALRVISVVALVAISILLFIALFGPRLPYNLSTPPPQPIDSPQFVAQLEALADAKLVDGNHIEPLPNGENFYAAELEAMRQARHSINVEAYIFRRGEIADRMLGVLTERARRGVKVNMVVDAVGALTTSKRYFKPLQEAGGRVQWYHPIRWNTWFRSNNRTHRELVIVDGEVGFIGGAGIADHWLLSRDGEPRWRDSMYRVRGDAVARLQGIFAENWVEASGELISGDSYFRFHSGSSGIPAMVVGSSPSSGASTRSRMMIQTLLAAARHSIYVTTPYFLPDKGLRDELIRAKDERGVEVKILVPGKKTDLIMTRSSSRALYGVLLKAGVEIHEYQPAMIHAKTLIIDGTWSVVGSTNLDHRSFGLNDEVNLAVLDRNFAARMTETFQQDLGHSQRIRYDQWKKRPVLERAFEWIGWIFERQQ